MQRADPDLDGRRRELLQARAAIDRELAEIEAGLPLPGARMAQDGRGTDGAGFVRLKQAAGLWGISGEAARKRALRLVPLGLAEMRRPGGWRVRVEALG